MDWWNPDYALPIIGALIAGGLIGFEREYRGRPAGFRTHILVCLTSAFLMLAAVHQTRWLDSTPHDLIRIDPVRMAHGLLTGIGFLCGGVIFREGFSVHGLTTAASLWITSAIGTLYGIGFYMLAVTATLVTLVVLALLRMLDGVLPQQRHVDVAVRYRREAAPAEAEVLALFAEFGLKPKAVTHRMPDPDTVEMAAVFHRLGYAPGDTLAGRLRADPRVIGFDLTPRDE